ncbi:MAG: N-6 DNA methylase, partial [Paludibacter sp.]|nr:N-6 DNA methylase [Paludibacter sp.]
TNVSVLFFDKAASTENVIFIDASKLGTKVKDGKNQRTILSAEEIDKIIETFVTCQEVEDFSLVVSFDEIAAKKYSFSAGQYFEIKIEYVEMTPEEFKEKISVAEARLKDYFAESKKLEGEIEKQLKELRFN